MKMKLWVGLPLVVALLAIPAVLDVYDGVQAARTCQEARGLADGERSKADKASSRSPRNNANMSDEQVEEFADRLDNWAIVMRQHPDCFTVTERVEIEFLSRNWLRGVEERRLRSIESELDAIRVATETTSSLSN